MSNTGGNTTNHPKSTKTLNSTYQYLNTIEINKKNEANTEHFFKYYQFVDSEHNITAHTNNVSETSLHNSTVTKEAASI